MDCDHCDDLYDIFNRLSENGNNNNWSLLNAFSLWYTNYPRRSNSHEWLRFSPGTVVFTRAKHCNAEKNYRLLFACRFICSFQFTFTEEKTTFHALMLRQDPSLRLVCSHQTASGSPKSVEKT